MNIKTNEFDVINNYINHAKDLQFLIDIVQDKKAILLNYKKLYKPAYERLLSTVEDQKLVCSLLQVYGNVDYDVNELLNDDSEVTQ